MRVFFIEMGQGIIFSGVGGVCTSPLSNCSFIAAYSATEAGAFHYPGGSLALYPKVVKDLEAWIDALQPTDVSLFCAPSLGIAGMGTSEKDKADLQFWVTRKSGNFAIPELVGAPAMEMQQGTAGLEMKAGPFSTLSTAMHAPRIDLKQHAAGAYLEHGGFKMYGCDRWKTDLA